MAAVLAKGTTVIDNAAREPEIADLAAFLNRMGAQILGAGSSTITVEGVEELSAGRAHASSPTASRPPRSSPRSASPAARSRSRAPGPTTWTCSSQKLGEMGMRISPDGDGAVGAWPAAACARSTSSTLPYPGFATDYKPLLVAMLAVADGVGIVTENLFAGRFRYVDELVRMGADIRTEGHHAVVRGVERLSGAPVRAPDIRAGAALVVAGLGADGETVVADAHHIDRGYERLRRQAAGRRRRRRTAVDRLRGSIRSVEVLA